MVAIQLDEETAAALEQHARSAGLTPAEYVRSLLPPGSPASARPSWEEIEREWLALSADDPPLPDDFSRADIYSDHD